MLMQRELPETVAHLDAPIGAEATISVIMPVFNAAHFLLRTLPPLVKMLRRGEILEVIVVDDGATDGSAAVAAELGARVISSGGRLGPAGARNVAAAQAMGDILWFVDSDVVVRDGSPARIRAAMNETEVVAVFGSYDDRPDAPNFGSQYKNLLHHHHHQIGKRDASTFWAGCGAVLRTTYQKIGGFDAKRYRFPSIEDIELGYRMGDAGGKIRLDPALLSTHLKYWSVPELVRVDILRRAMPWARLMLNRSDVTDDLNVGMIERLRAGLAGLALMLVLATLGGLVPLWTPLAAFAMVLAANWKLFSTFREVRGAPFAVSALLFHQLYYLYSTAAFVWCWFEARIGRTVRA
ncbi:MAG: glycosyltransferase [Phenylobacterium sp.]|uniref:glycosyltransferase family 2 protein n=1 Tax=Phenylobacterium sp. TaxID=1871053 RepID=UPI002734A6A1|nr:glycosyltransferase [Phenylobacterium sp.]MDP3174719.1 glycosyltransferase [Phenylobacterium sp.]